MADTDTQAELAQLKGALEILDILKEEFAQWLDEAQDDSKEEALENVLAHVEAMEDEYQRRYDNAQET